MSRHYECTAFKAAAIQASSIYRDAPQWLDLEATLNKAVGLIEEAGGRGARLIVFPECYLPGYPIWSVHFSDQFTFSDIWAKFLWNSVEVPSPETEALCAAAKRANAYVAMGINERDKIFEGRMYNSILYINPHGEIMGTHRKICNTLDERLYHTPGDGGDNLRTVFRTEIGNIGGSICGEHCQLLLTHNWIMQGIQIHCSLWPGARMITTHIDVSTRGLCFTARVFGVLAATYMSEQDWPQNFYGTSQSNIPLRLCGGSGIINPRAEYIAGPVYDKETIIYGDIDLSEVDKSRFDVNLPGIYSRWDLMNVNVRQEPYEPIVPMESVDRSSSESKRINDLEARIMQLEQLTAMLSRNTERATNDDE